MPMDQRKFIDVEGIETCYYEAGDGPPLVLFHGGNFGSDDLADCALDWGLNFDGLAERYRVIAIDKIGQGYTANPKTDDDYTMAATVGHAAATLDALGLKNAHIIGHSRGGYLVLRMTIDRPDLVRTCIAVDTGSASPGASRTETVMAGAPEPRLTRDSQRWVIERYSYKADHITDDWLDALAEIAAQPKYAETVDRMAARRMRATQFMPALQRDKMEMYGRMRDHGMGRPSHLIWGYNDPTASLAQGRVLYDLIAARERNARYHVFNQAGHFTYREHPAAFNAVVHGLIEGSA